MAAWKGARRVAATDLTADNVEMADVIDHYGAREPLVGFEPIELRPGLTNRDTSSYAG